MRILFYTDLHAADQTPKSRSGDYREDMLAKLRDIIDLANEYKVDWLINGADTFDRKSAGRVSHKLVIRMIQIMRDFPGDRHLTIVGTHDVPTGQLYKLPQQPLGVLQEAGVITVLEPRRDGRSISADYPDGAYCDVWYDFGDKGLIWDGDHELRKNTWNQNDVRCVFHAVPASYTLDKDPLNYAYVTGFRPETNDFPVITIAHGMIVTPGGTFFGDFTPADTIPTGADLVLYGHPHTVDGIYRGGDDRGTIFCGPGSVSRRDASPYNRARIPEVVLIETSDEPWKGLDIEKKFNFKRIPLPSARPPEEVFVDVRDEEDENTQVEKIRAFVHNLSQAQISQDAWGPEQLRAEISNAEVEQNVKDEAVRILDQVTD